MEMPVDIGHHKLSLVHLLVCHLHLQISIQIPLMFEDTTMQPALQTLRLTTLPVTQFQPPLTPHAQTMLAKQVPIKALS
jgi:hypothetical protein